MYSLFSKVGNLEIITLPNVRFSGRAIRCLLAPSTSKITAIGFSAYG